MAALALASAIACGTLESSSGTTPDASTDAGADVTSADGGPSDADVFHDAQADVSPDAAPTFTDVVGDTDLETALAVLADVVDGCGDGGFCPSTSVKRRDLYRWAVRELVTDAFKYPDGHDFDDVPDTDPDYPYVEKALSLGLTGGCSVRHFCPDLPQARAPLAVVLVAMLNAPRDAPPAFADEADIGTLSPWADKAYALGVQPACATDAGATDGGATLVYYCPNQQETRRSTAVALAKVRALLK